MIRPKGEGIEISLQRECPFCGTKTRLDNLERHVKKVHPGKSPDLKELLSADERKAMAKAGDPLRADRMSTGTKRLVAIGITILLIIGIFYVYNSSRPQPRLYTDHNYYDLGQVPQAKISHLFTFSNDGEADLTVTRIWTSCGCTTAKMILNGMESPEFGMPGHGGYTGPWKEVLRPGETADLVVYYDSASMPDLYFGERYVFIDSNDPTQPEFQFTIYVQEIP